MSIPEVTALHHGDEGLRVIVLHQQLVERGVLPPDADDEVRFHEFGPVTLEAVRTFQVQHGLVVDGIVGPRTWRALQDDDARDEVAPPVDWQHAGRIPGCALLVAAEEVGVAEVPLGSNRGPRVDEYLRGVHGDGERYLRWRRRGDGWQGAPWCGRFARWCFDRAAELLEVELPLVGWGDLASAWKWRDAAIARGRICDEPRPGCVGVIIVGRGQGHVVLVGSLDGAHVWTVEGNSGNRVARRRRAVAEFVGFVDLS